jgi:hypothetical protein
MGREDEIKEIAYCLWEQEGCCNGRDLEHWFRAEVIWVEKQKPAAKADKPEESDVKEVKLIAEKSEVRPGPDKGRKPAHRH